ncbi:MAG: hypothetical protein NUV75_01330 [Gallionella sp.]|nr:hypothetical protein [Gallionella sp.]
MSFSIQVVGKDKAKLKEAIRAQQVKDEAQPHNGVPTRVADHLCAEVDRVRIYEYAGRQYGLSIDASGSFHEQGSNESITIKAVLLVE